MGSNERSVRVTVRSSSGLRHGTGGPFRKLSVGAGSGSPTGPGDDDRRAVWAHGEGRGEVLPGPRAVVAAPPQCHSGGSVVGDRRVVVLGRRTGGPGDKRRRAVWAHPNGDGGA